MFIDSPVKVNYGSSGVKCCYGKYTSRAGGARPEDGAAAINIWSLRDQAMFKQHTITPLPFNLWPKRCQHLEVLEVRTRIVVWSFEDKRSVLEFWMTGDATQCLGADVAFADVPVPVDA